MYVPGFFFFLPFLIYTCIAWILLITDRESIKYDFNKSNYHYKFEHNFNFITYRGIDQREIRKHEIVLISSIL